MKKTIPAALVMFINILIVVILNHNTNSLTDTEFTSLVTLLLTFVGYINLVAICWPLNLLRTICVMISAILIITCLSGLASFFSITDYTFPVLTTLSTLLLCTIMIIVGYYYLKQWLIRRYQSNPQYAGKKKFIDKVTKFIIDDDKISKKEVETEPQKEEPKKEEPKPQERKTIKIRKKTQKN